MIKNTIKKIIVITLILFVIFHTSFNIISLSYEESDKENNEKFEKQIEKDESLELKTEEQEDKIEENKVEENNIEENKVEENNIEENKVEEEKIEDDDEEETEKENKELQQKTEITNAIVKEKISYNERELEDGIYEIYAKIDNNKVVSIKNNSYSNFTNVQLEERKEIKRQRFSIKYDENKQSYIIRALYGNKALDIYGGNKDNFTNVQIYEYNGSLAQQWTIKKVDDKYYNIFSKNSNKVLDIYGGGSKNGTNIQIYEKNGSNAQKFAFKKVETLQCEKVLEEGNYYISSALEKNKVLNVDGGKCNNFSNVNVWDKTNKQYQKFNLKYDEKQKAYTIIAVHSDKALDVYGASQENGANVDQYQSNNSDAQKWILKETQDGYYNIISKCSELYLDIYASSTKNGTNVQTYEGNNSNAQKFKFEKINQEIPTKKTIEDGIYKIYTVLNTNKALDISGGSYNNCANLQIWDKANVQQQKFQITYNKDGKYYEIKSVNSGKVLDVYGNGKAGGTNVAQYQKNGSIAQKWSIQETGNGSYYIIALNSGLYLDVSGEKTNNGTNVQVYERNESKAQRFIFKTIPIIEEDLYKISIKQDTNKMLDISGGSLAESANLQIWSKENVNQQTYDIQNVSDNYYKIIARHSNKVLTVTDNNNVVQSEDKNKDGQQWIFEVVGNGYYKIKSKNTGLYLHVNGNGTANGTNVQVFEKRQSSAQMFKLNSLLRRKGIDVSEFNGIIDWSKVKKSGQADFTIIRAGYRGYRTGKIVTDIQFTKNIVGIKANKINIGLYFFTQAVNVQEAIEEANYVLNLVKQHDIKLKYPIYIDTENSTAPKNNPGRADNLNKQTRTEVCRAFCDTIRNAGYTPGIYASRDWFYNNLDISQLSNFDIWVAHYTESQNVQTDYKYKYDMWQYTSSGKISGVYGPVKDGAVHVDMNICYKNY